MITIKAGGVTRTFGLPEEAVLPMYEVVMLMPFRRAPAYKAIGLQLRTYRSRGSSKLDAMARMLRRGNGE